MGRRLKCTAVLCEKLRFELDRRQATFGDLVTQTPQSVHPRNGAAISLTQPRLTETSVKIPRPWMRMSRVSLDLAHKMWQAYQPCRFGQDHTASGMHITQLVTCMHLPATLPFTTQTVSTKFLSHHIGNWTITVTAYLFLQVKSEWVPTTFRGGWDHQSRPSSKRQLSLLSRPRPITVEACRGQINTHTHLLCNMSVAQHVWQMRKLRELKFWACPVAPTQIMPTTSFWDTSKGGPEPNASNVQLSAPHARPHVHTRLSSRLKRSRLGTKFKNWFCGETLVKITSSVRLNVAELIDVVDSSLGSPFSLRLIKKKANPSINHNPGSPQ